MAKTSAKKTVHFQHFSSLSAMVLAVNNPFVNPDNTRLMDSLKNKNGFDWFGMRGCFDEVVETVTRAQAKTDRFDSFLGTLSANLPRAEGIRRTIKRGDNGDELDIHAVMRGNTDRAWSSMARKVKRGSGLLRVAVDIGGNAGTDADRLTWRGVAGATLAHIASKAGYSVEIVAGFAVTNSALDHSTLVSTTTLKPHNAAINPAMLASTVCLTGYFRTLGFQAIVKAADDAGREANHNLGNSLSLAGLLPPSPKVAQVIVDSHVMSEQSARDWVKQSIQLLGGKS